MLRKSILVISDQHAPYHHIDTLDFLSAIKEKYKPDCVVNIGDEMDWHSISFHDSHPGLYSPSHELVVAKKFFKQLEELFPRQYIMDSNHGSLVFRKATRHGLPHEIFKSYNHMLGVGKGWTWHEDLVIKASNGQKIYFCHGKYKDVLKVAQQYGMCTVQGHYHTSFKIDYWSNPNELLWGMQVGCLINMKSLAFEYNKLQKSRPVIGTGVIIDGLPILIPMVLDKHGRWNRKLPRGIRNKNPGNIKLGTNWDGLADEQSDPVFCVFKEAVWGIRALVKILLTYRFHHKRFTVESIIERWAPPSENDTDAYIAFVCRKLGVNPTDELNNTIEDYLPLVKAIIQMENGMQPYDDELLVEGMYKAWEGLPTNSTAS